MFLQVIQIWQYEMVGKYRNSYSKREVPFYICFFKSSIDSF